VPVAGSPGNFLTRYTKENTRGLQGELARGQAQSAVGATYDALQKSTLEQVDQVSGTGVVKRQLGRDSQLLGIVAGEIETKPGSTGIRLPEGLGDGDVLKRRSSTDSIEMAPTATVQVPDGPSQVEMPRVDAGSRVLPIGELGFSSPVATQAQASFQLAQVVPSQPAGGAAASDALRRSQHEVVTNTSGSGVIANQLSRDSQLLGTASREVNVRGRGVRLPDGSAQATSVAVNGSSSDSQTASTSTGAASSNGVSDSR